MSRRIGFEASLGLTRRGPQLQTPSYCDGQINGGAVAGVVTLWSDGG